eukprot:4930_1
MIHNFEQFGIDIDDLSLDSKPITQEIIQTKKPYKIADILSVIYGVSNGVMSICDSISDILFVLFLLVISHSAEAKTILVLTVGNLVSVGILISIYMCYQWKSNTLLQKVGVFLCFLLCSPILPSVEWLFKKCERDERARLEVQPNSDGILLWFKQ